MRTAILLFVFCCSLPAQPRISPRLARSGASSYLIVFRSDADMPRARQELASRGFDLLDHPDLLPNHVLAAGPQRLLFGLESVSGLLSVLPASNDLVVRRRLRACPGAISAAPDAAQYVQVGSGWPKDAAGAVALHFAITSFAPSLDENATRSEIARAFHEWETYANLTLTGDGDPAAARTITIGFFRGAHGDAYPFDGSGGMLAHTFYPAPPNPEPIAGDVHFDAGENWHVGAPVDLFTVALHEAGHALGLGHSDQPGAVMYPYYRQAYGLTSDDIAGIQDLYGARDAAPPIIPVTPPPPGQPPVISTPVTPPVVPVVPVVPVAPGAPVTPPPAPSSDRTPPSLRITSPPTTVVTTSAAALPIAGTASDDQGVTEVRWTTSTGDSGVASGTTVWSASVPVYPGSTVITVRAFDAAGNSSWRAITVTRR